MCLYYRIMAKYERKLSLNVHEIEERKIGGKLRYFITSKKPDQEIKNLKDLMDYFQ